MMSSDGKFQGEDERSHQGEDLRSTEERLLAEPIVSDILLSDKEMVGEAKAAISGGMMSSDEKFHQLEDRLSLLTSPTAAENPGNIGEEYFNQVCGSLLNFKKSS